MGVRSPKPAPPHKERITQIRSNRITATPKIATAGARRQTRKQKTGASKNVFILG
jgi:hypothetical protein